MNLQWLDMSLACDRLVNILATWSVAAVPIIIFGSIVDYLFRKQSGSFRHTIWLSTAMCVLMAPLGAWLVPGVLPSSLSSATQVGTSQSGQAERSIPSSISREIEPGASVGLLPAYSASDSTVDDPALNENTELVVDSEFTAMEPADTPQFALRSREAGIERLAGKCLLIVWIMGVIVCWLRIGWVRAALTRALADRRAVSNAGLERLVTRLAAEVGVQLADRLADESDTSPWQHCVRKVSLTITACEIGPLIWGAWSTRLILPVSMSQWSVEHQEAAVRHEFAHVQRRDEWVRCYLLVLRTLFWFHPLVRRCCAQVQLFAEIACDDQVLAKGHQASVYSRLLLTMGRHRSGVDQTLMMSGMAHSQIASRIASILQGNRSRQGVSGTTALWVAASMLALMTVAWALRPAHSATVNTNILTRESSQTEPVAVPLALGPKDWPQWGGTASRNNVPDAKNIPVDWDTKTGKNIRWSVPLGTQSYGGVVVAGGKVFTGTNNGTAYIKRFPASVDLGVLLCFSEADGKLLWQHSNRKLASGRDHDWPEMGICSAALVIGERLWYVTNRGEVVCLDTEGFRDGENDGPFQQEEVVAEDEADVVWSFDMMHRLGVSQHNISNCSVTCAGDLLFVNTSHGVGESHAGEPEDPAPSFLCLDRRTGEVLWTDSSPSPNILHGQWSSPAYAVLGGVAQVIFGGGDGFLYSFQAAGENGKSKLLWKFDCNPKESRYLLGFQSTRNHIVATPVIYDGLVYIAVGEDPEHGEGVGHVWCIDPTRRGDVSPTLVFNAQSPASPIPHKRLQALDKSAGDFEKPNANSAAVWHYTGADSKVLEKTMHRTCGTVAIKNDLLFIADFSGIVHCLDAKTGKPHWTYDLLAAGWASPLIVEDRVYFGDEDGEVTILRLSPELALLGTVQMHAPVYTTPIVANDTLFIGTSNRLFAIRELPRSP